MKKFLSIILAAVMLCSFAGCNKKNSKNGKNKDTVITWLIPGDKQPGLSDVMEAANAIIKPKLGVKIDVQFIDAGAYNERMNMNMASGMEFDLCFTGYVNPYIKAVKNGGLLDITELLDKEVPELKKAIPDYAWEAVKTSEGKIYAVPNIQVMFNVQSLEIRKEIAEKYNFDFDSVKKVTDIEPFLEMVKNGEDALFPWRTNYGTAPFMGEKYEGVQTGVSVDVDSLKVVNIYETDEYLAAVKQLNKWFKSGYIRPDVASVMSDVQDYDAGKYAVSSLSWKPGNEAVVKQSKGWDCMYVNLSEPYFSTSSATLTLTAVSKTSKHPTEALKVIELVNTDSELYNILSYGIEGKHYNLNKEGKIVYVPDSGYSPKAPWKFGNQFNALLEEGQDDNVWKETEALNKSSKKSPILGFVFDTDPVISEISACESVISEYSVMKNGSENPDVYYATFLKRLKSAGHDKIKAEVENQLSKFLKERQSEK